MAGGGDRAKRKKGKKKKKRVTAEQAAAHRYVREWVFGRSSVGASKVDDFAAVPLSGLQTDGESVLFEMHAHTTHSDGFLSPAALVERAHRNGVKVLALTDHDTMAGIPEALEAACKCGIRIIPGVEISTKFTFRSGSSNEEPVHILAYYGGCGPANVNELENCLSNIRDGRFLRAKEMLLKLKKLKMPIQWENLMKISGDGVAPGRLHVARAMVQEGYVENIKQAFSRYLYDGGPAYATGKEPAAEEAVQLICRTGGVAALAHPWALKTPVPIIKSLKSAGLHAMEVYRSDGKLAEFSELADSYDLIKLGGSDYHGRGGHDESDLGSVNLPVLSVHKFLIHGQPIWCNAIKDILQNIGEEPSKSRLAKLLKFERVENLKGDVNLRCKKDFVDLCLSPWFSNDKVQVADIEALRLKLSQI